MGQNDGSASYETIRRQRLQENQKRMEELGLTDLSMGLSKCSRPMAKPSARQGKPCTLKEMDVELRRSSRVSKNPQPNYREAGFEIPLGRRCYSRQYLLPRKYISDESRMKAAVEAVNIQKKLDPNHPSCLKLMLQSHVSGGFWLSLPCSFCNRYLSQNDTTIVLEDANCGEWETVFLKSKNGLSGGWRGFSLDHGLQYGDAIVFELVQQERLKVHIIRAEEDQLEKETSRVSAIKKTQLSNTKRKTDNTQAKKNSKRK